VAGPSIGDLSVRSATKPAHRGQVPSRRSEFLAPGTQKLGTEIRVSMVRLRPWPPFTNVASLFVQLRRSDEAVAARGLVDAQLTSAEDQVAMLSPAGRSH
jgi:hypothetical protein